MFPIPHGESRTKRHREPRRETNWYCVIEVWACAWAIGNMHWASTKLKLSFYFINLYVAFTWWKKYGFLYSYSRMRWIKRTLQIKRSRLGKKNISSIHLNPKTKRISPAGNQTQVSRVTGGDTHQYTTEELDALDLGLMGYEWGNAPSHFKVK